MGQVRQPGYDVCYLDGRLRVGEPLDGQPPPMIDAPLSRPDTNEARWLAWGRSAFAVVVVAVLLSHTPGPVEAAAAPAAPATTATQPPASPPTSPALLAIKV